MTLGFVGLNGGQEWGEVWPQVSAPVDADQPMTDSTASLPQSIRSSSPTETLVQPPVMQTRFQQTQTQSNKAQPRPTPAEPNQSEPVVAAAPMQFPETPSVLSLPAVDAIGPPLPVNRPMTTDQPQISVSPTQPMDTPTVTVPQNLVSPPVPPPVSLPQGTPAAADPNEIRPPYPTAAMTPVPPTPLPLVITAEARSLSGSAEAIKPQAQTRSIQVQIGTIEVRSAAPAVRPAALPRGFQDYLLLRRYVNQVL
jgi:hypothetical protein